MLRICLTAGQWLRKQRVCVDRLPCPPAAVASLLFLGVRHSVPLLASLSAVQGFRETTGNVEKKNCTGWDAALLSPRTP